MISESELTAMQDMVRLAMDKTVEIQRPAEMPDGAGGTTIVYTPVCLSPAYVNSEGLKDLDIGGRVRPVWTYTIDCPMGTDLADNDIIVLDGDVRATVVSTNRGESYPTSMRVRAVKL